MPGRRDVLTGLLLTSAASLPGASAFARDDLAAFRFAYEWEKLAPPLFEQGRSPGFDR